MSWRLFVMKFLRLLIPVFCVSFLIHSQPPCLFNYFPKLQNQIPYVELCDLPTPIEKMETLGKKLGVKNLYVKRDDLSGKNIGNGFHLYGGNKPRKLRFLLADAMKRNAKIIVSYGCAGSNHALATAIYAHELGLKTLLMLKNQPNSQVVRHNLLLDVYYDAEIQFYPNNLIRNGAKDEFLRNNPSAYFIPTGGSNPIGVVGFVDAACELADQIKANVIQEPDYIYVATNSCSTTAGLLLGLQAAQIRSKIIGVCVEPEEEKDEFLNGIRRLFAETNAMLHALDATFPLYEFPEQSLILNKKFCGTAYGLFIPEGVEAINLVKDSENIKLEGTYSAKPIAAIMDDAKEGRIKDETILFWDTYCGIDYSFLTKHSDYKKLPQEFHKYFQEDVQPLARKC